MSSLTAEGRRAKRDLRLEGIQRTLRKDKNLNSLSVYQRGTLAELKLIGRELYADIKRRGVILPDGSVNPAVEAHRKNCHEQLYSLSVYAEVNRARQGEAVDLVSLMVQPVAGAETVEPAAEPEGSESVTEMSSDKNKR
jgi:hypothetical protein